MLWSILEQRDVSFTVVHGVKLLQNHLNFFHFYLIIDTIFFFIFFFLKHVMKPIICLSSHNLFQNSIALIFFIHTNVFFMNNLTNFRQLLKTHSLDIKIGFQVRSRIHNVLNQN